MKHFFDISMVLSAKNSHYLFFLFKPIDKILQELFPNLLHVTECNCSFRPRECHRVSVSGKLAFSKIFRIILAYKLENLGSLKIVNAINEGKKVIICLGVEGRWGELTI